MRRVGRYGAAGLALLGLLVAALWPWLDGPGRRGIVVAAAVAWPVQVAAFGLLVRNRAEAGRFMAFWAGGTLIRMAVIVAAAVALTRASALAPVPTLLGLAGFFFGLLLLEPIFFRSGEGPAAGAGERTEDGKQSRLEAAGTPAASRPETQ